VAGAESLAGRDFVVSVHPPTHSLVVRSDPETIDIVRDLVTELDREPPRVNVELTVSEVSHLDTMSLALDALVPVVEPDDLNDLLIAVAANPGGNLFDTAASSGLLARVAQTPLLIPIVNPITGQPDQLLIPRGTGVLTADDQQLTSRVLLRPRLSMISGEEHEIFSGENIPVPTAETGDTGANLLQTRQTVERRDTGIRLRVQPTVPEDGPIVLELDVEVSRFAGLLNDQPVFNERTLEATVRLQPGLTAVVGWASLPSHGTSVTGTPFLKDIPFFGAFFRATRDMTLKTNLLIAVRAQRDRPEAVVLTRWMQRELGENRSGVRTSYAPAEP
jgi:type II secretory pathway component GspD/PulD (secretin)